MTVVATITKSIRVGSEQSQSGSETITADSGLLLNVETPAATDDDSFTLVIEKADLLAMYWNSTLDVFLRLISETPQPTFTVAGAPGELTLVGDYTFLTTGSLLAVSESTSNDGIYELDNVVFAAGVSTLTLVEALTVEASLAGTIVTFVRQTEELDYAVDAIGAGAGGTFELVGDRSDLNDNNQRFIVTGSTNNDGVWTIDTAVFGAPNTVITVIAAEVVGAVADGDIVVVGVDTTYDLAALIPTLWTTGGGLENPLITNVVGGEVTNESATTASDLTGRVVTD